LPSKANNFYIFPAVGMMIFATEAKQVSDEMFIEAVQKVGIRCRAQATQAGLVCPLQSNFLEVENQTAAKVRSLSSNRDGPASAVRPT
jgi:malate dehydrogenase (oxaloacetate-decarboxylating)(NADP+)